MRLHSLVALGFVLLGACDGGGADLESIDSAPGVAAGTPIFQLVEGCDKIRVLYPTLCDPTHNNVAAAIQIGTLNAGQTVCATGCDLQEGTVAVASAVSAGAYLGERRFVPLTFSSATSSAAAISYSTEPAIAGELDKAGTGVVQRQVLVLVQEDALGAAPAEPAEPVVASVPPARRAAFRPVFEIMKKRGCNGCHGGPEPSGGLNLSTAANAYAGLVGVSATNSSCGDRVVPGAPFDSLLMRKISGDVFLGPSCGSKMPKGTIGFYDPAVLDYEPGAGAEAPSADALASSNAGLADTLAIRDWIYSLAP